jgi:ribosomal protein S12
MAAAARKWNSSQFLEKLLPSLQHALITGAVTAGNRGELVAQIILLCAFDSACRESGKIPGQVVSIRSVLEQLLPSNSMDADLDLVIPDSLKNSSVACAQIVKLTHMCSSFTLTELAERHCGAALTDLHRGVDLIFPIITSILAIFLVQVKNHHNQIESCAASYSACRKMMPSLAFVGGKFNSKDLCMLDQHCVRLYFQLGASEASATAKAVPNRHRTKRLSKFPSCSGPYQTVARRRPKAVKATMKSGFPIEHAVALQIFGLESKCLNSEVRTFLRVLLDTNVDVNSFVNHQLACCGKKPFPDCVDRIRNDFRFVLDRRVT